MSPAKKTKTMNNSEKFGWAKPGDQGKAIDLPIDDIRVDFRYQRAVIRQKLLDIASRFNWEGFGAIVVMQRANGHYFVVDGQHRLEAAKLRGDVVTVKTIVFQSDGPDHEARAFLDLNTRRAVVRATDKFRAASRAGMEPERTIDKWLTGNGLRVGSDHGKDPASIAWVKEIVETWKLDEEACKAAVLIQRRITLDQPTCAKFHKGIWYLLRKGVDVGSEVNKIVALGGKTRLEHDISNQQIDSGVRTYGQRTFALGILRTINHKRRNKIRLAGEVDTPEVPA